MKRIDFYRINVIRAFLRLFKSNSLRYSFMSCLIGSFLIHFYFLANNFVNHDSIVIISNNLKWMLNQGKWSATLFASLEGPFVVNYISQIIGIIAISISSGIISETFHIKPKLYCIIIGVIMCSFPAVATGLMYLELDHWGNTLLFAVLSGYLLIQKGVMNRILGMILLTISLGSYPAYVGFTLSMVVLDLTISCIKNYKSNILFKKGILYISSIFISLLSYYIILKIFLYKTGVKLSTLKGINNIDKNLNPLKLFPSIKEAFINSVNFFAKDNLGMNGPHFFLPGISLLFLIGISILLLLRKKEKFPLIFGILSICSLPLCVNLVNAFLNNTSFWYITIFPFIMIPITLVIFIQRFRQEKIETSMIKKILVAFSIFVLFFVCFKWIIQDNTAYQKLLLNNQQYSAKINILISKIYSTEGYSLNKEIYVVGKPPYKFFLTDGISLEFNKFRLEGGMGLYDAQKEMYDLGILQTYISNQFGIKINFKKLLDKNLLKDDRILKMPSYPDDGSIKVIDGKIFIKLSQNI